ncbi:Stk1 family PASTA domain-containing Ser/Thr kinase [Bifidobacterium psychraerophilum]|jgi:serine/threonine-protein kinase|uniref:Stk1 family PASTA domain-containing Ser/Thr kinase n=1 Tax=Bifidobacterium psychraerophilum TaxID=218140 RepID=UPI0023F2FE2A|nr:Stk1 family PASTA domain-containing Ser/Thr kinase [Bifidobacterium psychraerophilum]MCI1661010.1 Stk1 family PASTA domain-containing Ser/Thr kinase [Bifidobacterium psychraerophilum]MCI1804524.1 Stk1 family PASTA domain-containing Ser/Thr kinase [Bifidobacterium psychraerophilum]MCI2176320.1 Stk1 family PASTA domain-containing Ser/Thr kinase [Bifidobacterium psychraerophilum]MCI2181206.1 Stk1 family PASTA domain-containing Ser/Thr kinase [Bifidobacterium psychraerophilum]
MSTTLPSSLANGRYELGQLIGRGGMAEVHVAQDARLGRTVAIKIMRSDLTNDEIFLSRFRREAHSVAQLNNPNIVSIYDSGEETLEDENGNHERVPYLVMEYVKGQTLRDIIKSNGPLSQRDAEQVMLGVLNALEYSHRMGIIHRDIKPGNIMISDQGMVKVMDFGIARALDDSAATMTQSQGVVGTAQYLSPEQARGESVDMRSDLYSAGCVLYEMLTGRPPFKGDSAVAIAYQHVSEVATPPSAIIPGLPKMWDSICAKAMAKDRQNRYGTAADFKNDVLTFMNGGTPLAAAFNPLTDLSNMKARKDAEQDATTVAMNSPTETLAATQAFNPAMGQSGPATGNIATATRAEQRAADNKKSRRKKIILWSIVGALVLAAAVAAIWFLNKPASVETVTVPEITSQMSAARAQEKIESAGLVFQEKQDTDSTEPQGTFTKQSPKGGAKVDKGSTVTVWFSTGPQSVKVPDVTGKSQDEARQELESAGFTVGSTASVEDSGTVEKDHVTRTDPAAGQALSKGSSVLLYISSGMTKVPDVTGKSQADALQTLNDQGFNTNTTQENSDTVPTGSVTRSNPAAGTSVEQGTAITVYVSKGKEQVTVPNVVGMTLKDAKSTIGSSLSVTTKGSSDDSATVTSTDPAAGSSVDKGSTITLTTSAPSATFDPNSVVGMSQSDATTELQSNGYTVKKNDSSSDDSATVTKVTVSNKQVTLYVDSN